MVAHARARGAKGRACVQRLADSLFGILDLLGDQQHLFDSLLGHHDDAVPVTPKPVSRLYSNASDIDRCLGGLDPHPILACPHPVSPGEDRIAQCDGTIQVAANTVDHRTADLVSRCGRRQQIAPNGCVEPPRIVQNDDIPDAQIVDIVADGSRILTDRPVSQRPGRAAELECPVQRHHAGALAGDSQPVHCIAEIGAAEFAQPRLQDVLHVRSLLSSISS